MRIDLRYLPVEDRMVLTIRSEASWLLTRRMLSLVVNAWLKKLEVLDLPDVNVPLGPRNFQLEHSLSLEFDRPQYSAAALASVADAELLSVVTLSVDLAGTTVIFKGGGQKSVLAFTRKESHMVLELVTRKARSVGWVSEVTLPDWLGVTPSA